MLMFFQTNFTNLTAHLVHRPTPCIHWKKKWIHFEFWPKKLSHDGTKIRPGIPSNWRIFELYQLDTESQVDNLTLSSYRESIWVYSIESIWVKLTQKWESSLQFDSQYRVNLTQIFSNYSECRVEFSSASDSIF